MALPGQYFDSMTQISSTQFSQDPQSPSEVQMPPRFDEKVAEALRHGVLASPVSPMKPVKHSPHVSVSEAQLKRLR
jgi:hypothetical protein